MSDQVLSLRSFLEKQRLARRDNGYLIAQTRRRFEQSVLLEIIDRTCAAFNREAGTSVVEEHAYLPPEPVVRSFTFVRGQTEYVMRLDLWGTKPMLVFLVRNWRDSSPNRLVRWFWRTFHVEPLTVDIKLAVEIREETISEQEVQGWFFYLLSGLSRCYLPSLGCRAGYGEGEE